MNPLPIDSALSPLYPCAFFISLCFIINLVIVYLFSGTNFKVSILEFNSVFYSTLIATVFLMVSIILVMVLVINIGGYLGAGSELKEEISGDLRYYYIISIIFTVISLGFYGLFGAALIFNGLIKDIRTWIMFIMFFAGLLFMIGTVIALIFSFVRFKRLKEK